MVRDGLHGADGPGAEGARPAPLNSAPLTPPPPAALPLAGPPSGSFGVLFAAAVRADAVDRVAEARALAAFRAARDRGNHGARTRRRDDWRPGGGTDTAGGGR